MDNRSSLSAESHARIQAVIAALAPDAPIDEESTVLPQQDTYALETILTVRLTLPEFVEMEERPEQFGCQEDRGWHILIRNVLGRYWSEITHAMVSPFALHGDQQIIFRASLEYQLMISDLMSQHRSSGSLTADATRDEVDAVTWLWLGRAIQRIMEDVNWYAGVPSSNFHSLYTECERDVRQARADEEKRANTAAAQPSA